VILKEISPEYSLEGLMLKLKLKFFGHLMQRTDSFEKTLMLGKAWQDVILQADLQVWNASTFTLLLITHSLICLKSLGHQLLLLNCNLYG